MNEDEHLEVAQRLTELADRLYQDSDNVAAAEMLRGTGRFCITWSATISLSGRRRCIFRMDYLRRESCTAIFTTAIWMRTV